LFVLIASLVPDDRAIGQGKDALEPGAIDAMVNKTLREIILRGAPIYNAGEFAGCYHLYEGSLIALRPLLGHRPELQKEIDGALILATRTTEVQKQAWVLRETMNKVMSEVATGTTVRGTVTMDKVPLTGGKVILWNGERAYIGAVKKGEYQIDKVPTGAFKVVIDDERGTIKIDPKYADPETTPLSLKITDGQPVTADIALSAPMAFKSATVQGKVTLDGKPLNVGQVLLFGTEKGFMACPLDRDGTYAFPKMKLGTYKVVIFDDSPKSPVPERYNSPRSTPLTIDVVNERPSTFDFDLKTKDEPMKEVGTKAEPLKEMPKLVLTGNAVLSGRVTLKGNPLAGGTLTLHPSSGPPVTAGILNGNYRAEKVPAGEYRVVFSSILGGREVLPTKHSSPATTLWKIAVLPPQTIHDFMLD